MVEIIWTIVFILMSIAFILAFIRLIIGPRLPDRVVALDLVAYLMLGFIAAYSIRYNQTGFLDVAIILALISFLGTVAFAYYIERRV
jgi:multicomponent Na+:H+ antiporter subunit F